MLTTKKRMTMKVIDDKGFWINRKGESIHPDMVRTDEKLKSDLLCELITRASEMREKIRVFKEEAYEEIQDYYKLLLQEYGVEQKRHKRGNLILEDFSGTKKVSISVSDLVNFDEKLAIAKEKIDEFLDEVTKDASVEVQTLIKKAFEVDKKGNISVSRVLALKRYDITHPLWKEAMDIIDDATQIVSTKSYIRFYEKEDIDKEYKHIALDLSKV